MTSPRSIHHRRRWYYALWLLLLALAAAGYAWWETPAKAGVATLTLQLNVQGAPAGLRAGAWIGPTRDWTDAPPPSLETAPGSDGALRLGPRSVRIAHRRLGQGLLLRRTDDLVLVALQAPSGERRWLVYDLREDLGGLLTIGRRMTVELTAAWDRLVTTPTLPSPRRPVGH